MKSILIIDDDMRNTFALSATLKQKAIKLLLQQYVEAFAILESEIEIGIILLDMMMPGMDGYDEYPYLNQRRLINICLGRSYRAGNARRPRKMYRSRG